MASKSELLTDFEIFSFPAGGIGAWLTEATNQDVIERLLRIDQDPLTAVQLNQLLVLGHEAPVSDAFFRYYWQDAPNSHPYNVRDVPDFSESYLTQNGKIVSHSHLKWGLHRLYIDGLLHFGNVRTAFRVLRDFSASELQGFFSSKRFDTEAIKARGPALPLSSIAKDDRYLISEMACKSYGDLPARDGDLKAYLVDAYQRTSAAGRLNPTVDELLRDDVPNEIAPRQGDFIFSATEVLNETVASKEDLLAKYEKIAEKFRHAREAALTNTRYYLSMLADLDVYVATSMRSRQDFREMADTCDHLFADARLKDLNLRYFDPTLSAAAGHEDKGLIECLMVKCAKVLVYCAGDADSFGKASEAAMALSLGKPVIFYCDKEQRRRFYRDVHPLSRLIEFESGVAVGAMVTDNIEHIGELIARIFENRMQYKLQRSDSGYLRLIEELTESVVRLQSSDKLLTETFWNHYHKDRRKNRLERRVF